MTQRTVVVGQPGTGKTYYVKWLIQSYDRVLVIDPLHEYQSTKQIDIYRPESPVDIQNEVEVAIDKLLIFPYEEEKRQKVKKYECVVFEECSRYYPARQAFPKSMGYLNDFARHMDLDMVHVARRFSQMHTDFAELADTLVIFRQEGVNDLRRCDEIKVGLSEQVQDLPKYHYVQLQDSVVTKHNPITL
jgi:hypothetical protein